MEVLYLLPVGIVLYFVADRLLSVIERVAGRRLESRSMVFFAILLLLALTTFSVLRAMLAG